MLEWACKRDGGSSVMGWILLVQNDAGGRSVCVVESRNCALFGRGTEVEICDRTDVLDLASSDSLISYMSCGTVVDWRVEV